MKWIRRKGIRSDTAYVIFYLTGLSKGYYSTNSLFLTKKKYRQHRVIKGYLMIRYNLL